MSRETTFLRLQKHRWTAALAVGLFTMTGQALSQQAPASSKTGSELPTGTVSIHLDPARTTVQFTAGSLHRVHGTFQLKGGVFAIDGGSGVAQGEILVNAESEKSNDPKLDSKIQNTTLESAKYPGIFFHPEKVIGTLPETDGEHHFKLQGSFNIHGSDHSLTVDVSAVTHGENVVLTSTFTVPYVQWGMQDASTFFMRDRNIRIRIESHGTAERLHAGS